MPLASLSTEQENPASAQIDLLPTAEMLAVINAADRQVALAVAQQIPEIAKAVDEITARIRQGGRLFYIGAGTSGRLGVLDASECPPTFNVPPDLVQGIIAGGDTALRNAAERAEDDPKQGQSDLAARRFGALDSLVGIAASGRTPYVLGAIDYARSLGAFTVGLSCTPQSELAAAAELALTPVPGPEVITGSTRMRAGTATKLALNMLSTGIMIRLGYVYGNLMVNLRPTNDKLLDRAARIVSRLTDLPFAESAVLLKEAGSVRVAIVMRKKQCGRPEAQRLLDAAEGSLRSVIG